MKIQNLWTGADFIWNNQRYCLIYNNGSDKECLAVKISYDESLVTGNMILSFNYGEMVKYCPRKTQLKGVQN